MTAVTLTLGGIVFQDFEVPDGVPFGGELMVKIHKLQGGKRSFQNMGVDLAPIGWRGAFRGPSAVTRARAVEALWKAGQMVRLTWGEFAYTVLITRFEGVFSSAREIPYSLVVEVESDDATTGPADSQVSPTQMITGDTASATAAAATPDLAGVMGGVQSAVAQVGNFVTATKAQLQTVLQPVLAAQTSVEAVFDASEAALGSVGAVGGIVDGGLVSGFADSLLAQLDAAQQGAAAFETDSYLGRIAANLGALSGNGQVITVAGGNLFAAAQKAYGRADEWATIASANGLSDPDVVGAQDLVIPPNPLNTGGVPDV